VGGADDELEHAASTAAITIRMPNLTGSLLRIETRSRQGAATLSIGAAAAGRIIGSQLRRLQGALRRPGSTCCASGRGLVAEADAPARKPM
jgi:hypothetical protein